MKSMNGVMDMRQSSEWSTNLNESLKDYDQLPIDMRFNEGHMLSIVVYSILMTWSAIGNITVLTLIIRRRRKSPSRINLMLMNLAIADLLVTFFLMPLEIGWAATVSWRAGDEMCRIMAFFRTFGLYLSSNILVCISIDRYYAVVKPLHFSGKDFRVKLMLGIAWLVATLCSMPQMLVFHVEPHPNITWYEQCITVNSFPSYGHEVAYAMFGMVMMYALPLIIIMFSYASTFLEIYKRARETTVGTDGIRRSSFSFLSRAKIQTLKMTIVIVLVFIVCWTPYYVMSFWYWFHKESAIKVDPRIQKGLFLFACTNSCANPIVYGFFNMRPWRGTAQSRDLRESQFHSSTRGGSGVACKVSWKKPSNTDRTSLVSIHRRRDVCLSCGETFEIQSNNGGSNNLCSK